MDSVSFPKGCLLSSTPVQSPEDSGYFGSDRRPYKANVNILSSCSPIKESPFKTVPEAFTLHHDSKFSKNQINFMKNESLFGSEINELSSLEFVNSNLCNETEICKLNVSTANARENFLDVHCNYKENAGYYKSLLEDNDIKYKLFASESSDLINDDFECSKDLKQLSLPRDYVTSTSNPLTFKQLKIDLIHKLNMRNCLSIVSHILSYLSAKELCIASCVSKEWKKAILSDHKANLRRKNFIAQRELFLNGPSKENRLGMRFGPAKEHKGAFLDITNINSVAHLPVNSVKISNKFNSFLKEAKNEQKLLKCPKCCFASKFLNGKNCVCSRCSYRFCCHCLGPIFKTHTCLKPEIPNIIIGSRRSKKNLRRL